MIRTEIMTANSLRAVRIIHTERNENKRGVFLVLQGMTWAVVEAQGWVTTRPLLSEIETGRIYFDSHRLASRRFSFNFTIVPPRNENIIAGKSEPWSFVVREIFRAFHET